MQDRDLLLNNAHLRVTSPAPCVLQMLAPPISHDTNYNLHSRGQKDNLFPSDKVCLIEGTDMASFSIAESPILPRVQSTNSSPRCASSRDWEEFSSALLEDGFILTALELHTELLECGKEVPSLRDYFSNPGNFEHAIPQPPSGILHSSLSEI